MFIDFPVVDAKMEGLDQVVLPKMVKIRQLYDDSRIENVTAHLFGELEAKLEKRERFDGRRTGRDACRLWNHRGGNGGSCFIFHGDGSGRMPGGRDAGLLRQVCI